MRILLKSVAWSLIVFVLGCSHDLARYERVERSLIEGQPEQADRIIEQAQEEYASQDRLLYLLDRGMTLHLAGRYRDSIAHLEEAERVLDRLYTKHVRDEVRALLVNDRQLPYEGELYEHVMVHIVKALDYVLVGEIDEALVEARKIDHRLNVLADSVDPEAYHEDPFARYFTGLLYEAAGDLSNAYVAYRKAEQAYRMARPWLKLPVPLLLKQDLLWITKTLGLEDAYAVYRERYPDVDERPSVNNGASLVLVCLAGRAPDKEEQIVDIPLSLKALQLVVLANTVGTRRSVRARKGEAVLYGLHGHIVRVALPRYAVRPSRVAWSRIHARSREREYEVRTIRVHDLGATAKKNLDDRYPTILARTAARAAIKMGMAEGVGYGVQAASHDASDRWIGALVTTILRIVALTTEDADTRNWRLLPGEIQVARLWVPAGSYEIQVESVDRAGRRVDGIRTVEITMAPGETRFLTHRVIE